MFLFKHSTPLNLLCHLLEPCNSEGVGYMFSSSKKLRTCKGRTHAHMCGPFSGVVCFGKVYNVIGRFKAVASTSVVWKIHGLALSSTHYCGLLQREFPNSYSYWKLYWLADYWLVGDFIGAQLCLKGLLIIDSCLFSDLMMKKKLIFWQDGKSLRTRVSQPSTSLRIVRWKKKRRRNPEEQKRPFLWDI